MHSNPGGLTHWATINSCHQTSLFPHVGHFKLGLSVNPTASLTQCLPAMQQSSSSNRILHLTLPSHFLSLLPPWSHSLCTLPPLQLSTASAASIARAEVLPCGRTDVPRGCLSPLSLAGTVRLQGATEAAEMVVQRCAGTRCRVRRCGTKCLTLAPIFHHLWYPEDLRISLSCDRKLSSDVRGVSKPRFCTGGRGRLGSAGNHCKIPVYLPAVVVGTKRDLAPIAAQDKKEQNQTPYCAGKMAQKSLYLLLQARAIPVVYFPYNTNILMGLWINLALIFIWGFVFIYVSGVTCPWM